jgi:hypothetical protein
MYECYEIDCPYCDGQQCCMEDEPYGNCVMCEDEEVEAETFIEYDTAQHMMEFLNWFLESYKVDVVFKDMTQKEFVETVFASYCFVNNITEVR